jgi:hypothetical protein
MPKSARIIGVLSLLVLTLMGWSTGAMAQSASDTTPPVLVGLSFAPATVNVANGPATVTVQAHITDNLSGVSQVNGTLGSPTSLSLSGSPSVAIDLIRTSGDALDGTYEGTLTLPQYSASGT